MGHSFPSCSAVIGVAYQRLSRTIDYPGCNPLLQQGTYKSAVVVSFTLLNLT